MVPQQSAQGPGRGGPPAGFAMPVEAAQVKIATALRQIQAIGSLRSNESVIVRPELAGPRRRHRFRGRQARAARPGSGALRRHDRARRARSGRGAGRPRPHHLRARRRARAPRRRHAARPRRGAGADRAPASPWSSCDKARLEQAAAPGARSTASSGCARISIGDYRRRRPGDREPRADRSAQGRFPRAGALPAGGRGSGRGSTIAVDALSAARASPARSMRSIRRSTWPGRAVVIRARIVDNDERAAARPLRARHADPGRAAAGDVRARAGDHPAGRPAHRVQARRSTARASRKTVQAGAGEARRAPRPARSRSSTGSRPGDRVVTAGVLKIRDGMPVQVMPAGGPNRSSRPPGAPAAATGRPAPAAGGAANGLSHDDPVRDLDPAAGLRHGA